MGDFMSSRRMTVETLFSQFQEGEGLTDEQRAKFKIYYDFLLQINEQLNLTAITMPKGVLNYHFADSLVLRKFLDMSTIKSIADVGSGAGFPALPLKIVFPHLRVLLIEVNRKKREFLRDLIRLLELKDVEICEFDWRTFLRTTTGAVDLFVSRAALNEVELARLFRHTSSYRDAQLVYWVSETWQPLPKAQQYIRRVEEYKVYRKRRKLVFMSIDSGD